MNQNNVEEIERFMDNLELRYMLIEALLDIDDIPNLIDNLDLLIEIDAHRVDLINMLEKVDDAIRRLG